VELWITDEASVVLAGMVASHDLPQALVKLPTHRADVVDAEPLFEEELAAVVPPSHPLRGQASVPLAALARDELLLPEVGNPLRDLIVDACLTQGFQPVSRIEFGKKELAYQMALEGVGVGLVPLLTARHDLPCDTDRVIRISQPQIVRSVGTIRHRSGTLSPADQAIRGIIRDVISDVASAEPGMRVASTATNDPMDAAYATVDARDAPDSPAGAIFHDSPGPWAEIVAMRSARAAATIRRESGSSS
jgi:DNA-binding transcriptional LysR family regulator